MLNATSGYFAMLIAISECNIWIFSVILIATLHGILCNANCSVMAFCVLLTATCGYIVLSGDTCRLLIRMRFLSTPGVALSIWILDTYVKWIKGLLSAKTFTHFVPPPPQSSQTQIHRGNARIINVIKDVYLDLHLF